MKQTKKQPINVQLSKEDLKELLTVLKNFIVEELLREERESERLASIDRRRLQERITRLEMVENSHRGEIHKLKQCCLHDDKLDHIRYYTTSGDFLSAVYRCKRCSREVNKTRSDLSRKEKKALKNLGVKI